MTKKTNLNQIRSYNNGGGSIKYLYLFDFLLRNSLTNKIFINNSHYIHRYVTTPDIKLRRDLIAHATEPPVSVAVRLKHDNDNV